MLRNTTISLVAYLLLFPLAGSGAIIILPLIVALFNFICYADLGPGKMRLLSAALIPITVFLGSALGSIFLSPSAFANYFSRGGKFPGDLLLMPLAENQVTKLSTFSFIGAGTFFAAVFALCLFFYGHKFKRLAPGALLVLIILVFVIASFTATPDFRSMIAAEPKYNSYSYDGIVNLKAFYLMSKQDFYHAYVEAASGDSRLIKEKVVRRGKFYGYVGSPFYFRFPVLFYLWRLFAGGNGIGIFYLALAVSAGILALSMATARALFGNKGALLTIAIMPYLFIGQNWSNMLLLDWWAANALLAGIFFWLKKQFWPSALAFLAASLFREVFFVFLLIFLIFTLIFEKTAKLKFLVAAGAFIPFYAWHFVVADRFIGQRSPALDSIFSRLAPINFSAASDYQFFVYGFNLIPAYVILIVAAISWLLGKRPDMFILSLLAFPYFAFASTYYWGQHLMLFLAFSAFAIFLRFPRARLVENY